MRLIDADALMESIRKALGIKSMAKSLLLPAERTIIDQIDSASTVNGWISVKDKLPEENEAVNIVWMNAEPESYYKHIKGNPFVATGVYFRGKWYWWSSVVQDYLAEYGSCEVDEMDKAIVVTHWQAMPEPPKVCEVK